MKGKQVVFEVIEAGEFIGCKHLALDNGEIDLDLVEPAGVDRGVNQHHGGPRLAQAVGCFEAAVRRTVVGNPENASRRAIGFDRPDLLHESVEGRDAGAVFAAAEELGPVDVPSGQVGAGPAALVFVFDASVAAGRCWQRGVKADAGLNAGFLVGRDDKFVIL